MYTTLEVLFSSTARVQVMRLFLLNRDAQFYQREIERQTGQPIRAVQREVERLEEVGLLLRTPESKRVFYRVNPEFPLLPELTALFGKAAGSDQAARPEEKAPARPEVPAARQPFAWLENGDAPQLPSSLRRRQVECEWDRGY